MGHEYGGYSYIDQAKQEPLLREGDIDLNPTLNHMRQAQRVRAALMAGMMFQRCVDEAHSGYGNSRQISPYGAYYGNAERTFANQFTPYNEYDPMRFAK